jgi:acyl-CoA synthetase (AMP-forming)/AMP-acid ligase II
VAVLSENRLEYIELELAAAHLGLIIACLNWRLADDELTHCIHLVSPALLIAAPRYQATVARLNHGVPQCMQLGPVFEQWREQATPIAPPADVVPEDGLVILYTSGTTGMPKGALISQRAMVARMQAFALDYGITGRDGYIAWSPLFHMAATDHALATLMLGGKVTVHDGLDVPRICHRSLAHEPIGWLVAMPGMIEAADRWPQDPQAPGEVPARGGCHGRSGAATPNCRAHAIHRCALHEQLWLYRDRLTARLGRAAADRRCANQPVQTRVLAVPHPAGGCRGQRRAR